MKRILQLIACVACVFFFASCEERALQRDLVSYSAPLDYLHDTRLRNLPKTDSVFVQVGKIPFNDSTIVRALKRVVVPLLVVNYSGTLMGVSLGKKSMQEEYPAFVTRAFSIESDRSSSFEVLNGYSDSTLVYEISIDTCFTTAIYQTRHWTFLLIIGVSTTGEEVSSALTHMRMTGRLKKGNVTLFEKRYAVDETQAYLRSKVKNQERLRQDMTTNLVESLSLSTKKCIEWMVADLDAYLKAKK